MKLKKLTMLVCAILMAISLTACGNQTTEPPATPNTDVPGNQVIPENSPDNGMMNEMEKGANGVVNDVKKGANDAMNSVQNTVDDVVDNGKINK